MEDFINNLSDQDWGWYPFLFLRPPKDVEISNAQLLKITLFYLPFMAFLSGILALLILAMGLPLDALTVFLYVFGAEVLGFVFFMRFLTAHFWNLRARRLQWEKEKPKHSDY